VSGATRVYVEVGGKRAFAIAADWPGWARSGKNEEAALEALAAYAPRYAKVARLARLELPEGATSFEVVERLKGTATTDFGAPGVQAKEDSKSMSAKETARRIALLEACWKYLDQVRARVPQELLKGPRGGGRDRDKMYAHVVEAELGYAGAIGLRMKEHDRKALLEALRRPIAGAKWPAPFALRRIAWHALDHAWEMEDRIP
jgi:hypothetical protein